MIEIHHHAVKRTVFFDRERSCFAARNVKNDRTTQTTQTTAREQQLDKDISF